MWHRAWIGWLVVMAGIGGVGADGVKPTQATISQPSNVNESAIFTDRYIYLTRKGDFLKLDWNLKILLTIHNIKHAGMVGSKIAVVDNGGITFYDYNLKKLKRYKIDLNRDYDEIKVTANSIIYGRTDDFPTSKSKGCRKITSYNYLKKKENWSIVSGYECNPELDARKNNTSYFDRYKITQKYVYLGIYGEIWPDILDITTGQAVAENIYKKVRPDLEHIDFLDVYTASNCVLDAAGAAGENDKAYGVVCGKKDIEGRIRNKSDGETMEWRRLK